MKLRKYLVFSLGFVITNLSLGCKSEPEVDLIIKNATVVDGTGAPGVPADVAVANGRIVRVGPSLELRARETLDATGLVVAPGFIDVHTHADKLAAKPLAENFIRMGVTSVVAGNCGSSPVDVGEALAAIEKETAAVNFATLIGHNSVRREVMGKEQRAPTAEELQQMKELVAKGMDEGAVGFSTGLQYVPGTYADTEEIIELASPAGERAGIYTSHMRNEGTEIEAAIREALTVGEESGCRVEISHLKIDSQTHWGLSSEALALIDQARDRGLEVQADQYAYTAASSNLGIRFPSWVLEGGEDQVNERLDDEATWQRIKQEMKGLLAERGFEDLSFAVVANHEADPSVNGLSIKEIAEARKGSGSLDNQLEVAREMLRAEGAGMVYHLMSEEDVERIMRHPYVGVASDASINTLGEGVPHPRGYGNNARVLGHYVREKKVISLEEAVRKMTSLPARHFRFADRGLVAEGYAADLVLFDANQVAATATFEDPHAYAAGIPHVLVNGVFVVRDGQTTGARPGQVLRSSRGSHE